MLSYQAAGNSVVTSGAAKKNFFPREIIVIAGFENNSKEHHIFSEFKHGFCDKMENKKIMRKRVVKETHIPFSFPYFSSQAKTHA